MYRETSKLLLFSNLGSDSILFKLADIFYDWKNDADNSDSLRKRIFAQIKRLLDLSTDFGFDENLWHNYLTYILITNENSFTLTCEMVGPGDGSVNVFAKNDCRIFKNLFDFDFSEIERDLGINCFSVICDYKAIPKKERMYNVNVSRKVRALSRKIENTKDENEVFDLITDHYRNYGIGLFGLNKAFRIKTDGGRLEFCPINNTDSITFDDLIGYEYQKKELMDNTEAFLKGRAANNVLLYGDAGTGKSSSIKALINKYYDSGLRLIEIYKHQFEYLSAIIATVKNRNYKFIIYIDDLSFEENEVEYKFLKAVIEGGLESRPDNMLIYATSNRRHLIKETWKDRDDMEFNGEIHRSDTIEEKLSLAGRFGISINYSTPTRNEYLEMVKEMAKKQGVTGFSDEELCAMANRWEMRHAGICGRTAQQFVNYLAGQAH